MNRWWSWNIALLLVALLAFRAPAQDKDKKDPVKKDDVKKDDAKKDEPKKPEPKKPVQTPPIPDNKKTVTLTGEVIHVESGKQGFRIRVPEVYVEVNEGEVRAAAQEQANMAAALARGDRNAAINHRNAMLQHQARIRQAKTRNKDLTLEAVDKVVVRLPAPKESFDEMGNVKRYTPKELDALRGKDKMFDGEFSDLTNGQIVQVTVIVPKMPAKPVKKDDIQLEEPKIEAIRIAVIRQPKIK